MGAKAIVTIPPYAPYMKEVLNNTIVSGIRLNTVMPLHETLDDAVKRLNDEAQKAGKDLWIDLKCRQLRVKTYGVPPFTEIELTHNLTVDAGTTAYFSGGLEKATILSVKNNRLLMQEGPKRVVGPGEAINILHPSLKIEGYLTDTDKKYIEACSRLGLHNYMASFVEGAEDLEEIGKLDGQANLIAKIESQKGIEYVQTGWNGKSRLMAARGDLFVELKMPHHITQAVEAIVRKDPNAIVASRIFDSLAQSLEPSCADIGDADNLLRMGYRAFMFGDEICMERNQIMSGLNLLRAMAQRYEK
ncbi:MAG: pyruvate kinase [Candidatus Woesearchaeota archaeon]